MKAALLFLGLLAISHGKVLFEDTFESADGWVKSKSKSDFGDLKLTSGKWKGDQGYATGEDARFYGSSKLLPASISNEGKTLVFSFSVSHEQSIDCGGGYVKLLPKMDPTEFNGDTEYSVMFGPDICGATKKIHLIFTYKGKNLLWKKEPRCESDELTHFYTVIVNSDNTYEVRVDNEKKESGSLEEDWDFLEPKEIDDPSDKKPDDWEDEAEIVDPEDKKPSDWDDEPEQVKDPDASKPEDWDEEEDGEWEAPMIPNPKYKGEWKAKMIANPKYKGVWKPKTIDNPDYKPDSNLYLMKDISAVGIDLWQVKAGSIFDNILVSDDVADAEAAFKAYKPKLDAEKKAKEAEDEKKRKEDEEKAKAAEAEKKDDDEDEDEDEDKEEL